MYNLKIITEDEHTLLYDLDWNFISEVDDAIESFYQKYNHTSFLSAENFNAGWGDCLSKPLTVLVTEVTEILTIPLPEYIQVVTKTKANKSSDWEQGKWIYATSKIRDYATSETDMLSGCGVCHEKIGSVGCNVCRSAEPVDSKNDNVE